MIISLASINIWTLYLSLVHTSLSLILSLESHVFSLSFFLCLFPILQHSQTLARSLGFKSFVLSPAQLPLPVHFFFFFFFSLYSFQLSLWHDLFFMATYIVCYYTNRLRHRDRFPFLFYNPSLLLFFKSSIRHHDNSSFQQQMNSSILENWSRFPNARSTGFPTGSCVYIST